jgi:multidrug resistance efflux pump
VGSLNAGRVGSVGVDVGDAVARDQVVGTVVLPSSLGTTAAGTPKVGFRGTDDEQVPVLSPIDGVVVARSSNVGDTVAAGQPLLTVVDPHRLWVQALIEETSIGRVHPGQSVEVTLDALGRTLPGRVTAVDRATAGTFSMLPQGNTSGNFTKVTQLVAVKIAVDYGQTPLVLGSSVEVRIRVAD